MSPGPRRVCCPRVGADRRCRGFANRRGGGGPRRTGELSAACDCPVHVGVEVGACAEPLEDVAAASLLEGIERCKGGLQLEKDLLLLVVIKRFRLGNEIDEVGEVGQRGRRRFR